MTKPDNRPFGGVLCPLVTPFRDGAIAYDDLEALVEHVLDGGVTGLVPCGTTGEFASLGDDEYRAVIETTVECADGAPVMAGTAHTSVEGTLDRVSFAADAGADAALVTLPYFHTANDPAGNEAFVSAVADDAPLPIYLYNIPACTGQEIPPSVVEAVADRDSIAGLKDSGGDFNYFGELVRRTPDSFQLFQGFDSHLVPALVFGGTGGINALSNVVPEVFAAAYEAATDGDVEAARRIHRRAIAPLFQQCVAHGFAPATKAGLLARDVISSDAVRPPLVELDGDATADVAASVDAALAARE
ncbi:dihydrodipicolinate synthase family protein [Halomarina pelagica]|uniref:dihydrodipicolinate synthase family protein n=1 Tax=Halomarina pelagica TaxID=2961599 RepID=UPI0020C4FB07|nr:dihydrodipicolinate synthase family protein [Halomarina sp. BND7]